MQRLSQLMVGLALAVLVLGAAPGAVRAQGAVLVSVSPAAVEVAVGQTVDVAVTVNQVSDLYAFNLTLTYDPALVEVVDADPSLGGDQAGLGLFLEPGFVARNIVNNEAGIVRFTFTQLNPATPKSGSGNLIVLKLRGKAAASGMPLVVNRAELAQRDGTVLPVNTTGGVVAVVAQQVGPTSTSVPTQGAGTPLPTGTGVIATVAILPTSTHIPANNPGATLPPAATATLAPAGAPSATLAPAGATEPAAAAGATTAMEAATAAMEASTAGTATTPTQGAGAPPATEVAALGPGAAPQATPAANPAPTTAPGPGWLLAVGVLAAVAVVAGLGVLVYKAATQK